MNLLRILVLVWFFEFVRGVAGDDFNNATYDYSHYFSDDDFPDSSMDKVSLFLKTKSTSNKFSGFLI